MTSSFSNSKIKKVMQEDQDVGNIHPEALFVVSKITEQFLAQLVQDSAADCAEEGTKVIRPMNLKHILAKNPQYDFLEDIREEIKETPPKKTKGS